MRNFLESAGSKSGVKRDTGVPFAFVSNLHDSDLDFMHF
jgi:hypothetical protein